MKTNFVAIFASVASIAIAAPPDAIQSALATIDADIKPEHYEVSQADLDGDGTDDVFVLMNGQSSYRGSGGTTLFAFRSVKEKLVHVGKVSVVNDPIYLRKSASHGLRDLLVSVSGGGAKPGLAALAFDGKTYPASPGEASAKLGPDDQVIFAEGTPPLSETQTLQGITFQVSSPNTRTGNSVTLTPSGLEADNNPITTKVAGLITRIETADINGDGSPEIYIYGFDGKSQTLLAYSANKKKSLSIIAIPDLTPENAKGYRGRDEFAVVENTLARRFPIFPDDNPASKPTAKIRQIQYKVHSAEATWTLKVDKVVEF